MSDTEAQVLPTSSDDRKAIPLASGVLDYFPGALAEVAKVSKAGNDQHNPGQPLHWSRGKSTDHADTIMRHLADRGKIDADGQRHSAKIAWRALALLQEELEAEGATPGRGSKFPEPDFTGAERLYLDGEAVMDQPEDWDGAPPIKGSFARVVDQEFHDPDVEARPRVEYIKKGRVDRT